MSAELMAAFVAKWCHPEYGPNPILPERMNAFEQACSIRLPVDYRAALEKVGAPSPTIALLNRIVDDEVQLADISEFLEPEDAIATWRNWVELGLSKNAVPFASDCMGNLFCFNAGAQDATVWFFDHETATLAERELTFAEWLGRYLALGGCWSDID